MARRSRSLGIIALLILAAGCGVAPEGTEPGDSPSETTEAADVAPAPVYEAWFVELEEPPLARGGDPILLHAEKERFRAHAAGARLSIVERYAFDRLWNGVSVHVDHRSAPILATLPGVKRIFPVVPIELDRTDSAVVHPKVTSGPIDPGSSPDLFTAIQMTGADVAQSQLGLYGDGVRVGVIDSGIDINHPDLGGTPAGCFGPGCRVAFGYDFVGDAYDAGVNGSYPVPDSIPDDCGGHGTHVAGIIGANGTVKGVAPHVTFGAYRVFGCSGSTNSDVMIKAMEMAEADGMRVVNMSIGSSFQWPDYPTATAADQLVADGVVVVCSIGNSGNANGLGPIFAAGAPGVARNAIGVASYDNIAVAQPAFTITPAGQKIGFTTASALSGSGATSPPPPPISGSLPMSRTGTATTANDACSALPAGSLTGTAVLIRRGTCTFTVKVQNAVNAGAAAVVLYNSPTGSVPFTPGVGSTFNVPVVAVSYTDGATIDTQLAAGAVTLTWGTSTVSTSNPTGGQISSFSSWGFPPDLSFKPDLGAPGGSIYSTYPLELGAYASLSGTSMSSPHVAGAAALLVQARPEVPASLMRDLLQNTAVPAAWTGDNTGAIKDSVIHQGAGLIHVDVAAQAPVIVTPGKLALGESQAGPAAATLTLTNTSTNAITYDLTNVSGASVTGSYWTPTLAGTGLATVSFGAPSVTVPAGGTATVSATITADGTAADGTLYGGWIVLTPQGGGTTLRVPYAGYKGDYQAQQLLTSGTKSYPWLAKNGSGGFTNQPSGATFTLQSGDIPYVVYHLEHGARRVKLDVYDAVKGKPYGNVADVDYVGQATTASGNGSFSWNGTTLFNKQAYKVPNGTYVLKLSALKPLGDANNPADWETWTSPVITLNHP
jgi:subtilisin family serine protease